MGLALGLVIAWLGASPSQADPRNPGDEGTHYRQIADISVPTPNNALYGDIIYGDQQSGLVYFSDGSNSTVDVVNGRTDRLVAQVPVAGGPAGIVTDGYGQAWIGSGSGSIVVLKSTRPFTKIGAIPVGAPTADEIAYDPRDHIIAVTSPDATDTKGRPTPWVTLIDARPGHHRVLGHVVIPGAAADSIEQPQWNPASSTFVEAIRATTDFPNGEVAQIDPKAVRLQSVLPVDETCNPGGLAVGPNDEALLGCNVGAPALISLATGRVIHVYSGHDASGADEVAYDAKDHRYYAAEAGAVGPPPNPQLNTPTVMVIDAHSRRFVTDIALGPTALGFHQVTALFNPATVFVPQSDGIHVYTSLNKGKG
ncbi:MAG TPA: hypothetical protein VIG76_00040 [Amnibacterium sp.]|jgi:DNA-binding beta-propeller fold protein YncE|uniref:hypothetical protein n=1 Tax=Amnibacterium sp. TaxID=1872496 RepID=UPI002F9525FA